MVSWWQSGFLSQYWYIFYSTQVLIGWIVLAYAILMGVVMVVALASKMDFAYANRSSRGLFMTLVFILSLAEFFMYEFCPDVISQKSLVDSFWGLVVMVVLAVYSALQARMIHILSQAYLLDGDSGGLTIFGFVLLGVSLFLILLSLPLRFLRTLVVIIVLLGLIFRLLLDVFDMYMGDFSFGRFIGNAFWFLVCAVGFMSVALMMIPYYTFGRFLLAGWFAAYVVVVQFFLRDVDESTGETRLSEETIRENAMRRERRKAMRQDFKDYMRARSADRARAAAEAEEERRRYREQNYPSPTEQVCENCRFYEYSLGHCSRHGVQNLSPRDDCSQWEWKE